MLLARSSSVLSAAHSHVFSAPPSDLQYFTSAAFSGVLGFAATPQPDSPSAPTPSSILAATTDRIGSAPSRGRCVAPVARYLGRLSRPERPVREMDLSSDSSRGASPLDADRP